MGHNPGLTQAFTASGAIPARSFVKFGADDDTVTIAGVGDDAIGVTTEIDAADGETVDVHLGGVVEVIFGGNVGRGKLLASGANGQAIQAAPADNTTVSTAGRAMCSGVAGDIGLVLLGPGSLTAVAAV
ncbi:MAG TPA: capsid cement protein [Sphingomonas sp.]|nr:capsid cement protein [Sphingomonas sp.]